MKRFYENTAGRLVFRILLALVACIAVILSFLGQKPITLFFTNWSVWFAAVMSFVTLIGTILSYTSKKESILDSNVFRLLKFAAEIMIFATFVVSSFVLPDKLWTSGFWTLGGAFKHFLLPLLYIADGILCDPRSSYRFYYVFTALIPPIAYWAAVITRFVVYRNAVGGSIPESQWNLYYPYGFTNIDNGHTLGFLIGLLGAITVGLILTGTVLYLLNRKKAD